MNQLQLTPVLLPTDKSVIGFDDTRLCLAHEFGFHSFNTKNNFEHQPRHLYLCSSREIEVDGWCMDIETSTLMKVIASMVGNKRLLRIEFTTDPRLMADGVPAFPEFGLVWDDKYTCDKNVPFLPEFVSRYNGKKVKGSIENIDAEQIIYEEIISKVGVTFNLDFSGKEHIVNAMKRYALQSNTDKIFSIKEIMDRLLRLNPQIKKDSKYTNPFLYEHTEDWYNELQSLIPVPQGEMGIYIKMEDDRIFPRNPEYPAKIKLINGQPIIHFK